MTVNPYDEMREAATAMREQHGPEHPRHEMWQAMAAWLDKEADLLIDFAQLVVTAEKAGGRIQYQRTSFPQAHKVALEYLKAAS